MKPLLALIFLSVGFFPGAQESSVPVDPIRVVIFPYSSPDPQVTLNYGYALFAVPDLLQEKLENSGRFIVLKLPQEDKIPGAAAEESEYRQESAEKIQADYFIWGYLLATEKGLKVVHKVMETRDGRTVKVETQDLPLGVSLIDVLESSAVSFSEGLKVALVPLPPQVKIIEKLVERVVEVPTNLSRKSTSNLETSTGLAAFLGNYNGLLAGALFFRLELTYPLDSQGVFDWGADLSLQGIKKAEGSTLAPGEVPELAYLPMLLKSSVRWHLPFLDLGWELKAGGSLFMGTYGGNSMFMMRPSWSTGALMELWPQQSLSLRFHLDYLGTWLDLQGGYLPSLRLGMGLGFDL